MVEELKLRFIELRDTLNMVNWRNENAEFFPPQEPLTYNGHYRWYCKYLQDMDDFVYMVCLDDGTAVGTIGITRTSPDGYEIGRVLLGRRHCAPPGIMSEALQEVMKRHEGDYYWLKVLTGNDRAIRFYCKNGFRPYHRGDKFVLMWRDHDPAV